MPRLGIWSMCRFSKEKSDDREYSWWHNCRCTPLCVYWHNHRLYIKMDDAYPLPPSTEKCIRNIPETNAAILHILNQSLRGSLTNSESVSAVNHDISICLYISSNNKKIICVKKCHLNYHPCDNNYINHHVYFGFFSLAHVSSSNMEEAGFMTNTAASHQVAITMLWLRFRGAFMTFHF